MANPEHLAALKKGVDAWNRWRDAANSTAVDLSGADLSGMKLNGVSFLRANLTGANLTKTQLEHAQLKDANLTGATLVDANLEHVYAREARFDNVVATGANFEVATLRGATFRGAKLSGARFHRAYLRETDLTGADLTGCWLRFAVLEGAQCEGTDFAGADLRHASFVDGNLKGANLTDVHVFGVSAWRCTVDDKTRQDLIISVGRDPDDAPLRAHNLHTAQLLALMLDSDGVRRVIDSVGSTLVLILGSFAPEEKVVLDALRDGLKGHGYIAVTFDFARPTQLDYLETVVTLAGMSRFIVADFTNAKEVRAEVAQARSQYKRVPIIPIAKKGVVLPVTMANYFSAEEIDLLVRYVDVADLVSVLEGSIIGPAEKRANEIAATIAAAEAKLRGD
jgi:uncharacterized protein YjbI with pentapeptide repeats